MQKAVWVCIGVILLAALPAQAWEGRVVRVCDGDTVVVARAIAGGGVENVTIRLHGIDTPETKGRRWPAQPYSKAAGRFVANLLASGRVAVMDMGYDKYARTIAGVISLPEGKVVQEELLRAGLAWVYTKYCRDCSQWKELEREAKNAARGLWGEVNPVAPWEWRKGAHGGVPVKAAAN